jgi:hypothetical protein
MTPHRLFIQRWLVRIGVFVVALATSLSASAEGPETSLQTEYLMTLHVPFDTPQQIDQSLLIFPTQPGGSAEGPRIKGKILSPAADWLRVMPSGVFRLDVRETIRTDDDALIYVSFNGVAQCSKELTDRLFTGEQVKADDCYFIVAPTFQTKSDNYAWLNGVQAVGKMVSFKPVGAGSHVRLDLFAVR